LLILAGILAIGIAPPPLMDRLRKPGWKATAIGLPPSYSQAPRARASWKVRGTGDSGANRSDQPTAGHQVRAQAAKARACRAMYDPTLSAL
jgi:hypothetical protein